MAAWNHDGYFACHGQQMFDVILATNTTKYCISIDDDEDFHIGKVIMSIKSKPPERMAKIPRVDVSNLSFPTCL